MMKQLLPLVLLLVLAVPAYADAHDPPTLPRFAFSKGLDIDIPEDFLRALADQSNDIALVSYTVNAAGGIDRSDPVLMHNADQPMVLASTIKIVILAAYAREVAAGRLDPEEPVTLGEWESFFLPFTGDGHERVLEQLGLATGPQGFALDPTTIVPMDAIAAAMIVESDNAATDFLQDRLGGDAVQAVIDQLGLSAHEKPQSLLGLTLTVTNPDHPRLTGERLRSLLALSPEGYAAEVSRLAALYRHDAAWRAEAVSALESGELVFRGPNVKRLIEERSPKGSAREYAEIMARVVSGNLISPEASALMRRHLEWPMALPFIPDFFATFGQKGGSLPGAGVLTGATYSIPLALDFAGKERVVVVFLRDLDEEIYSLIVENDLLSVAVIALATSRDALELTRQILCIRDETTLCLNEGRFRVQVAWEDFDGNLGAGRTVPVTTEDSGLIWFFDEENWELLVKVLDGCSVNGHYWVFSAAVTNVGYVLTVTDTATGTSRDYGNPVGVAAAAVTDTSAFATCP